MRTLSAAQADLARRSGIAPVPLVRVRTFDAGALDQTFYLSSIPVLYDWSGLGAPVQFEDAILGISRRQSYDPPARRIGHLAPDLAPEEPLRIYLANEPGPTGSLWDRFRAANLEHASIEYAELLVDPARFQARAPWNANGASAWWDLRDLPGGADEHQFLFVGEVVGAALSSDHELELEARRVSPRVPWIEANGANVPPRDRGRRLPVVYGVCTRVPCVTWDQGFQTTTASALPKGAAQTSLTVTPAPQGVVGFPAGTFRALLNDEEIECSNAAEGSVFVEARGLNGTKAVRHPAGSILRSKGGVTFVCAGHEVDEISAFYIRGQNGQLVKVPNVTGDTADPAVIPGARVATVRFAEPEFAGLVAELSASTGVTSQPAFRDTASGDSAPTRLDQAPQGSQTETVPTAKWEWTTLGAAPVITRRLNIADGFRELEWLVGSPSWPSGTPLRFRLYCEVSVTGNGSDHNMGGRLWCEDLGINVGGSGYVSPRLNGNGVQDQTGDWRDADGRSFADFQNAALQLGKYDEGDDSSPVGAAVEFTAVELQIEYQPTASAPTIEQTVDVEAEGPSTSPPANIEAFADLRGMTVPFTYTSKYGFPGAAGWTPTGDVTIADAVGTGGAGSAVAITLGTVRENCNSAARWSSATHPTGDTTEFSITSQGSGIAMRLSVATNGTIPGVFDNSPSSAFSISGRWLGLDLHVLGVNHLDENDGVRVRISSSATPTTNYREYRLGTFDGLVVGQFRTLWIDGDTAAGADATSGTFNPANVQSIRVTINQGATKTVQNALVIDEIKTIDKVFRVQRTSIAGTNDWTPTSATSPVRVRYAPSSVGGNADHVERIEFYWSNTSSASRPAAYRQAVMRGSALGILPDFDALALSFAEILLDPLDVGSPAVSNVETFGVEFFVGKPAPDQGAGNTPILYLDDFAVATGSASQFGIGGAMILPAETMLRHFLEEFCGLGGDAIGSIGSGNVVGRGVHVNALGETFEEIVAAWAYELRGAALIPRDRANAAGDGGARVYDLVVPSGATPTYGSPVAEVTDWDQLRDQTRGADEQGTRFVALYNLDPSEGLAETAYRSALEANAANNESDVATSVLEDAEDRLGVRSFPPFFFLTHMTDTMAADVLGFFAQELASPRRRARGFSTPSEAYALEVADVITATLPGEGSPRKWRITERARAASGAQIHLGLAEVP